MLSPRSGTPSCRSPWRRWSTSAGSRSRRRRASCSASPTSSGCCASRPPRWSPPPSTSRWTRSTPRPRSTRSLHTWRRTTWWRRPSSTRTATCSEPSRSTTCWTTCFRRTRATTCRARNPVIAIVTITKTSRTRRAMAERRGGRLDTPREQRRTLIPTPTYDRDAFGVFAEQFARFMGTARFLMWMTVVVVFWVGWNALAPNDLRFDEYPFIFLTLILSLQASYAAPLILLAQNRQESRDKVVGERERQANARAHADMEFLAREVASLRIAVGEVATRDFLRSELRSLRDDLSDDDEDEAATPA